MDPLGLRRLVLLNTPVTNPKADPKKVKSKRVSACTMENGKFCLQIQTEMRTIKSITRSGRTIVQAEQAHPEFWVWKVRDTLLQEDREHFNHPPQWEAVIGYARTVLAKHFDVHPLTIRDWVKAARAVARKSQG